VRVLVAVRRLACSSAASPQTERRAPIVARRKALSAPAPGSVASVAPMRHGTYSIVAFDPATGELGAAVQSHWFSVGSLCIWGRAGVGAVATQSVVEPAYGPDALDRIADGIGAQQALGELLSADPLADVRQVAVVDVHGGVGVHTGRDCIVHAAHVAGPHHSAQANMMARETVPQAMSDAYEAATGPLHERLLAALQAAEAEGGDVRGRQSAAMLVVPPDGEPWRRTVDLRVEDHADPIAELARLLLLQRAYDLAGAADELLAAGRTTEAGELYRQASALAPDSDELLFWAGLALAQAGALDAGVEAVRRAAERQPSWLTLLDRLSPEFAPAGAQVRSALDEN
jgi:uncharacterized Ntn-hydrolase superfamily protein